MATPTIAVSLTLNELEILLIMLAPREKQQLGAFFDSGKAKLMKARNELMNQKMAEPEPAPVTEQAGLF